MISTNYIIFPQEKSNCGDMCIDMTRVTYKFWYSSFDEFCCKNSILNLFDMKNRITTNSITKIFKICYLATSRLETGNSWILISIRYTAFQHENPNFGDFRFEYCWDWHFSDLQSDIRVSINYAVKIRFWTKLHLSDTKIGITANSTSK